MPETAYLRDFCGIPVKTGMHEKMEATGLEPVTSRV